MLVNFLDIIDILIKCPESPKREEKIEEINLLFIHMHHLINEFRPHQARETLRVMLMVQRRKRTQFTAKFKEQLEKVETIIQEAIENLPEADIVGEAHNYDIGSRMFLKTVYCLDPMDTKEKTESPDDAEKMAEEEREYCSSLDRIMCQIVDELNCDMA